MIEKLISAILMSDDKMNSYKDNLQSSKPVNMLLKCIRNLTNFEVITLDYI
jgi:hypothetical protein